MTMPDHAAGPCSTIVEPSPPCASRLPAPFVTPERHGVSFSSGGILGLLHRRARRTPRCACIRVRMCYDMGMTTLSIPVAPETEAKLRERATANGQDVASYAARLLNDAVQSASLDEILAPVRRAFEESGMTDDELSDLLEREKHAMRAERREAASRKRTV